MDLTPPDPEGVGAAPGGTLQMGIIDPTASTMRASKYPACMHQQETALQVRRTRPARTDRRETVSRIRSDQREEGV